ncbi:superoxide dismutase family protein [Sphingomonas turrisvirgatae]|nr:superoxide dismutase family protein [Sphingomonas turrisvirgatae]
MIRPATLLVGLALATTACGGTTTPNANVEEPVFTNEAMPIENEAMGNAAMGNQTAAAQSATAALAMADGTPAGSATATQTADGLAITVSVTGIPAGPHGVHVHMTGKCEAPKFESAGGHWNPTSAQHGLDNPKGSHAGDMPNLTAAADGTGNLSFTLKSGTMAQLLDADGSAFVVHAGQDDQKTDPSGNSGDRIACGVFAAS